MAQLAVISADREEEDASTPTERLQLDGRADRAAAEEEEKRGKIRVKKQGKERQAGDEKAGGGQRGRAVFVQLTGIKGSVHPGFNRISYHSLTVNYLHVEGCGGQS